MTNWKWMTMMIKLYSGPLSLFSRKIEIALREKDLAFERVMVPFTQAAGYRPKHPDVVAANPKAQVPVLIDGALTLFDSTVIFEYLEDAYPEPALYPEAPVARARCRQRELIADEVFLPLVARLMYRTEPADLDPTRQSVKEQDGARAEAELKRFYQSLDRDLAGQDFFCGAYTVADIAMFMTMLFARRLGGPPIETQPVLAAWFARMVARPAVATAAEEIAVADRELALV